MGYDFFAQHYDTLTQNIDYVARAEYFQQVFQRYGATPNSLLDLACGTGSLSYALADLGYDMIATDSSPAMLSQAMAKAGEEQPPLFLLQSMEELELYDTVDGVICALDSVNHLPSEQLLETMFANVAECLEQDHYFIFDVNTTYKHQEILANNTFVYEYPEIFCVWQNELLPDSVVEIQLDFFEEQRDGSYLREQEVFRERIFSEEVLRNLLEKTGFQLVDIFAEDSFAPPTETEQRLIYVARRS